MYITCTCTTNNEINNKLRCFPHHLSNFKKINHTIIPQMVMNRKQIN